MKFHIKNKFDISKVIDYLLAVNEQLVDNNSFDCIIDKHHEKRTKTQNAYMWELINEMANILRLPKEEVYVNMLKDYGQSQLVPIRSDIDISGYFKYYEEYKKSFAKGKEYTYYKIFKGSSEMNSKEMSILIDGVVAEAKQLGIQTLTPAQIMELRK